MDESVKKINETLFDSDESPLDTLGEKLEGFAEQTALGRDPRVITAAEAAIAFASGAPLTVPAPPITVPAGMTEEFSVVTIKEMSVPEIVTDAFTEELELPESPAILEVSAPPVASEALGVLEELEAPAIPTVSQALKELEELAVPEVPKVSEVFETLEEQELVAPEILFTLPNSVVLDDVMSKKAVIDEVLSNKVVVNEVEQVVVDTFVSDAEVVLESAVPESDPVARVESWKDEVVAQVESWQDEAAAQIESMTSEGVTEVETQAESWSTESFLKADATASIPAASYRLVDEPTPVPTKIDDAFAQAAVQEVAERNMELAQAEMLAAEQAYATTVAEAALPVEEEPVERGITVITKEATVLGDILTEGHIDVVGRVKGNIDAKGDVAVHGIVRGDIEGAKIGLYSCRVKGNLEAGLGVIVDDGSVIGGDVKTKNIIFDGKVKGNIDADNVVVLRSHSYCLGDVSAASLAIEPGAVLNGKVRTFVEGDLEAPFFEVV